MQFRLTAGVCLLAAFAGLGNAQTRVSLRNTYERAIWIVPMTGAGTPEDPRRPSFVPTDVETQQAKVRALQGGERSGVIAYSQIPSDDGLFAIVEVVAADRATLKNLAVRNLAGWKTFLKGRERRTDIETEIRKIRKDFSLAEFGVAVP